MKTKNKKSQIRELITPRLIEIGVLIVGIIGLVILFQYAKSVRAEVAVQQRALETRPNTILLQANIRSDLRTRQHDIDRIFSLVGTREEIGGVISTIESVAAKHGVQVQIPSVKEEELVDERGTPIEVVGPHRNVIMSVTAVGDSNSLVEFMHNLEHIPHLVVGSEWRIRTNVNRVPGFVGSLGPENVPGQGDEAPPLPPSILDASLVLSIENDAHTAN